MSATNVIGYRNTWFENSMRAKSKKKRSINMTVCRCFLKYFFFWFDLDSRLKSTVFYFEFFELPIDQQPYGKSKRGIN